MSRGIPIGGQKSKETPQNSLLQTEPLYDFCVLSNHTPLLKSQNPDILPLSAIRVYDLLRWEEGRLLIVSHHYPDFFFIVQAHTISRLSRQTLSVIFPSRAFHRYTASAWIAFNGSFGHSAFTPFTFHLLEAHYCL